MYFTKKITVALVFFICCNCQAFPEYIYVSKADLEHSKVVVFALNTDGPMTCGEYGALVVDLGDHGRLSCLDSKVEKNIDQFNSGKLREEFVVLSSFKGDVEVGSKILIDNRSTRAFTLGKRYMLFIDIVDGQYVTYECSSFEYDIFSSLFSSGIEKVGMPEVVSTALDGDALCSIRQP